MLIILHRNILQKTPFYGTLMVCILTKMASGQKVNMDNLGYPNDY